MITPLAPQEAAAARRWLATPANTDTSSDGRWACAPQADSVVLTDTTSGQSRTISTAPYRPSQVTVADDGRRVAFLAKPAEQPPLLAITYDGGPPNVLLKDASFIHSIDFSPSGDRIACTSIYDVNTVDCKGSHGLAKLPTCLEGVEYLPGGRLLAEGRTTLWASPSLPVYWIVDAAGQTRMVDDVAEAESLGKPVRAPLLEGYKGAYPGASLQQREQMLDKFGYNGPRFRVMSPDQQRMVFEMAPRLAPMDHGAGLYVLTAGQGPPQFLSDPLGGRSLSTVEWSSGSKRAALVLTDDVGHDAPQLAVAAGDGSRFRVLPVCLPTDRGERPMFWSENERWLAFEVPNKDHTDVYCYDAEQDIFYPVKANATLDGWADNKVLAHSPGGRTEELEPLPLTGEQGIGLVLGGDAGHHAVGEVKVTDDFIIVNGVRVPRRKAPL